jgi:hypothetical protein
VFNNFNHSQFKRYILAFASVFSQVTLTRVKNSNEVQRLVVPLEYGPKDRWFVRLKEDPTFMQGVSHVLPRMSFEVTSVNWDSSRKLNTMDTLGFPSNDIKFRNQMYVGVPYNLTLELSILTKLQHDAFQIVEQILPFFTPDLSMLISVIPELGLTDMVPLTLLSVAHADNYEGTFEGRRAILWTMAFHMKVNFYGPQRKRSRIEEVMIDIHNSPLADIIDGPNYLIDETSLSVLTTEDGKAFVTEDTPNSYTGAGTPTVRIDAVPYPANQDPTTDNPTSNTTITEDFTS